MSRYKLVLLSKKNSYPLTNDDIQRNYQTTDDRAGFKPRKISADSQRQSNHRWTMAEREEKALL